jgi:hypothetical protein
MSGPRDLWAVGSRRDESDYWLSKPFLVHWHGAVWNAVTYPRANGREHRSESTAGGHWFEPNTAHLVPRRDAATSIPPYAMGAIHAANARIVPPSVPP